MKYLRFVLLSAILTLCTSWLLAQPNLGMELIVGGFNRPVDLACPGDGTGRLFVVEKAGVIRIISDVSTGTVLPTPFLNISTLVDDAANEQGLLGLAFAPDYATSGHFYVNYTRDPGPGLDRTVIARYTVSSNPNVADPGTAVTIMEIEQDFGNHNGGCIQFGMDNQLYIAMGDGGSGGDPNCRAQDPGSLLGKILRIDVNGSPQPGDNMCGLVTNYGISPGNPFIGTAGVCDEIWATGVRNPWRFSFDMLTGDMYMGDVGQNSFEEINFQAGSSSGGENYGWKVMEANFCFDPDPIDPDCPGSTPSCGSSSFLPPVFSFNHSGGNCSVTGGYVYRGTMYPGMIGYYIFGDYCSQRFWTLINDGGDWKTTSKTIFVGNPATFGQNESGDVFMATDGGSGAVYRVVDLDLVPLDLLSFKAHDIRGQVHLVWQATNLINFSHFEVERSNDGRTFIPIDLVDAPTNSTIEQTFETTDRRPLHGLNYYRLKMVDIDGSFEYSMIRSVEIKSAPKSHLWPNPSREYINIRVSDPDAGDIRVDIFNMHGQIVDTAVLEDPNHSSISVKGLKAGAYLLRLTNDSSLRDTHKVIIH